MDDKLLSYGDCLLRVRDVALLTGPHWLNDAVMSFFFEYLRSEGAQPDEPHADRVVLVDASLSFLVANVSPDEARAVLAPLGVSRAHMALFLVRHARVAVRTFSTSFDVKRPKPL
jgi:sentrin-specific protease 8